MAPKPLKYKSKSTGPRLPNQLKGALSAPNSHRKRKRDEDDGDVYEYTSSKNHRRAGVKLSLDKEEAIGAGKSSEEEGGQMDHRAIAKRIADLNEEGGKMASEDDEEIESDGAFEESDEERFAGFSWTSDRNKVKEKQTKKGKNSVVAAKKPKLQFAEVNLDEDEFDGVTQTQDLEDEVDDEEDSDEFLDVLDVLDGRAGPYVDKDDNKVEEEEWGGFGDGKVSGGEKRREGKKQRWKKRDRIAKVDSM